jgi:hypothetical protein
MHYSDDSLMPISDPFGASSVTPTLNKLAGFRSHLIDRITNKVHNTHLQSHQRSLTLDLAAFLSKQQETGVRVARFTISQAKGIALLH